MSRLCYDLKYILLNQIVNKIPSWTIRKKIYCLTGMKIGVGSRIGINTIVINPEKIQIGNHSIINENCHLDGRGGLYIGNNTSISIYTKILTASHKANSDTFEYYSNKTSIHNNVWIGCGAIILDGSRVNDKCVIGAGAVLKGEAIENGIYIGNPIKYIKSRELDELYEINYSPFFR